MNLMCFETFQTSSRPALLGSFKSFESLWTTSRPQWTWHVLKVLNLFESLVDQYYKVVSLEFNVFQKFRICMFKPFVHQHCYIVTPCVHARRGSAIRFVSQSGEKFLNLNIGRVKRCPKLTLALTLYLTVGLPTKKSKVLWFQICFTRTS